MKFANEVSLFVTSFFESFEEVKGMFGTCV